MKRLDAVAGEDEGGARRRGDRRLGDGKLRRRNGEPVGAERQPVEFLGIEEERVVARLAHIPDDRADGSLDVLGGFPLGRKKGGEARLEIIRRLIEPDRHPRPRERSQAVSVAMSCTGFAIVAQAAPRSARRVSMHSTSRRTAPPPAK